MEDDGPRPAPGAGADDRGSGRGEGGAPAALPVRRLRFTTASLVRAVLVVAAALALAAAFDAAARPLSWILTAGLVAGLLRPLAQRLDRHVPRALAMLVVAVGPVLVLGFLVYRSYDDLDRQVDFAQQEAPKAARELEASQRFGDLAREVDLSQRVDEFVDGLPDRLRGGSPVDALRANATRGAAFFATFVLMVFFLVSGPRAVDAGVAQVRDPDRRAVVDRVVHGAYWRWWRYVVLSLGRAAAIGLVVFVVLRTVGVPAPTVLAIWVAVWSLVPGLGIVVGSFAPVLLAVPISFRAAGLLLLGAVVLQVVDALVVQPRIERRSLHVGPFLVLLAGVLGLELYGVGGMVGGVALVVGAVAVLDELAPDDHSDVLAALRRVLPPDDERDADEVDEGEPGGDEGDEGPAAETAPAEPPRTVGEP